MGENGNEEKDYNVEVALKIAFKNREFNCLLRPELEKDIIGFLNEINEGYIVDGSEEIQFLGDEEVIAKYDFCCNDVSPEEAESFARYKIHQEEDRFEERGLNYWEKWHLRTAQSWKYGVSFLCLSIP